MILDYLECDEGNIRRGSLSTDSKPPDTFILGEIDSRNCDLPLVTTCAFILDTVYGHVDVAIGHGIIRRISSMACCCLSKAELLLNPISAHCIETPQVYLVTWGNLSIIKRLEVVKSNWFRSPKLRGFPHFFIPFRMSNL